MKTAVFSGRFDPPHVGHVLTVKRLLKRYDRVIVVVLDYDSREGCTTAKAKEILCELLIGVSGPGIITIITDKHHFGQIEQSQYLRLLDECFAEPRDTVYVSGNPEVIEHWKATMQGLMFEFVERSEGYSGTEIRRQQREENGGSQYSLKFYCTEEIQRVLDSSTGMTITTVNIDNLVEYLKGHGMSLPRVMVVPAKMYDGIPTLMVAYAKEKGIDIKKDPYVSIPD